MHEKTRQTIAELDHVRSRLALIPRAAERVDEASLVLDPDGHAAFLAAADSLDRLALETAAQAARLQRRLGIREV
ncbi:hypothetical protein [Yoonia sp.]|uniref:hypothetical protein n=1 Tax=Yoonia sp. TaxID=2212373 RepID=UPI00358E72B8